MRYNLVFHPSWWHAYADIDFSTFWNDPDARIAADIKMRKILHKHFGEYGLGDPDPAPRPLLGSDLLACGYLPSQILGCQVTFPCGDAPQVHCAQLDEDEAAQLTVPDFDQNPVWLSVQQQIDYLLQKFGRIESYINLSGVQNMALDLRGQDLFLDYYDEDGPAEHLLDVCFETMLEMCRRLSQYTPCLSGGVSNIVESVLPEVLLHSNCSVEMISESIYESWLLKYDQRLAMAFPIYGIHHCGKSMERVIKAYAKVDNLRFVEVGAFSDLRQVVAALNKDTLINARYSPVRLSQVSSDELRTELREMVEILPEERLSISCVGIDSNVPIDRVKQFCAYCKELL